MSARKKETKNAARKTRGGKKGGASPKGSPRQTPQQKAVAAIVAEPDRRKRWEMEQALAIAEMVRLAKEDGERQAREAHELGRRYPGERIGAGELVDILMRQRDGG